MILIDALYVNCGGSKVLLDYLIVKLEETNKQITYLLDERIRGKTQLIKDDNRVVFMRASLLERHYFYRRQGEKFSTVLCFGNLPPTIKLQAKVYTYFHHPLLLEFKKDMTFFKNAVYLLKMLVFNFLKKNSHHWIVQTGNIKHKLHAKYRISKEHILLLPFYEPFTIPEVKPKRIKAQYVYVSLGIPYKNHKLLINAFCKFYDQYQYGKLVLTISDEFSDLIEFIEKKQEQHYPIINVGFVDRKQVKELFLTSEYHIFPSLTESLGLGIIESIDCDCKVIGADLSYMHAVCEASITFNPTDINSVIKAFTKSLENDVKLSRKKIENKINDIVERLK